MSEAITRAELSERWGIAVGTLGNWARDGKGPASTLVLNRPLYLLAEVEEWEAENIDTLNAAVPGPRLSAGPLLSQVAAFNIEHEYLPLRQANAIKKAKLTGHITLALADEIACDLLRMHPYEIWGEEYAAKVWGIGKDGEPAAMAVAA